MTDVEKLHALWVKVFGETDTRTNELGDALARDRRRSDETAHGSECRCSECAAAPISVEELDAGLRRIMPAAIGWTGIKLRNPSKEPVTYTVAVFGYKPGFVAARCPVCGTALQELKPDRWECPHCTIPFGEREV